MATDKKYIKESGLENVYKRMRQINEYIITNARTTEADELQPPQNQSQEQPMPAQNQGEPAQPPQGEMPQGADMNMPQGNDMGGMEAGAPEEDPNAMGDAPQMDAPETDPTIGAEAPDMPEGDMGEEPVGEDDEVIDVDELTNSQEAAEYKIDGVDDKLSKLLSIAGKFVQAIEANDAKLEDLKAEIERRNPTDAEKINIRSQNSRPFSINPGQYWEEVKEKNPNYNVISNNEVAPNEEDKVYTITDDDLKDFRSSDVEKSFSDFPNELLDYFK